MTDNFIGERFSQLREARNVSARKMSLDLGHSTSYMNAIEAGRKLPSLSEFPYLCEYLGINEMSEKDVALLLEIIEKLNLYGTSKR